MHSVSPKCLAICSSVNPKFVMVILTGGGMEQGDVKFEFGASLAEAGEKRPVDYHHTTYLLPLVCM